MTKKIFVQDTRSCDKTRYKLINDCSNGHGHDRDASDVDRTFGGLNTRGEVEPCRGYPQTGGILHTNSDEIKNPRSKLRSIDGREIVKGRQQRNQNKEGRSELRGIYPDRDSTT